jgi:hypothetical protein
VRRQNLMFEYFSLCLERAILAAKSDGKYDDGVSDITGSSITMPEPPRQVWNDGGVGGGSTQLVRGSCFRGVCLRLLSGPVVALHLSVCLPACLPAGRPACLPACLPACRPACLPAAAACCLLPRLPLLALPLPPIEQIVRWGWSSCVTPLFMGSTGRWHWVPCLTRHGRLAWRGPPSICIVAPFSVPAWLKHAASDAEVRGGITGSREV